ncbi:glycoside hydrolase family 2 protein [Cohnella boryungensis]|uniref:Glycoside hydrolase family 2 protein n=2 Tax=Cohnella boryungensis TaxID=768479 RepID=A0ABV8SI13_9BACL
MLAEIPRSDYPRPQFRRDEWMSLNGAWAFDFDDQSVGLKERWQEGERDFTKVIQVPFAWESPLSGVEDMGFHDVVWYRRNFSLPDSYDGKRIILNFGAVDYEADVWVNGKLAVTHEGGHTPFSADITELLANGTNLLVVRAYDPGSSTHIPRGKQYWEEKPRAIWYTRTTGIWQSVWLEAVAETRLDHVTFSANIERNEISIGYTFKNAEHRQLTMRTVIKYDGELVAEERFVVRRQEENRAIGLGSWYGCGEDRLWSPSHPNLYEVEFELSENGSVTDRVASYFGMRKVSIEDGRFCLNNRPVFMKLVLDQGYYPGGNLTPPSDDTIRRDIELTKEMGFNGVRKHQKVEDPRYMYWCDKLGLMVWGEMANAYDFSAETVRRMMREWHDVIVRDYNHPCIVVWVPMNESFGAPNIQTVECEQHHAMALYYLTKSLDYTRPVVSNDGWEQVKTDLFSLHDYDSNKETLLSRYRSVESLMAGIPYNRKMSVGEFHYAGQPVIVSECGGIRYQKYGTGGWGYTGASDDEQFMAKLEEILGSFERSGVVQGYCYTQLTDVEQETNGLLTFDRRPKVPLERIRRIVDSAIFYGQEITEASFE